MSESEPMQARFLLSERDYVRANLFHMGLSRSLSPLGWGALALLALLLTGGLAAVLLKGGWLAAVGIVGCAAILPVYLFLVIPWILRRHYRQYKMLHQEQTVTLLDSGVRFDLLGGCSVLTWDLILKWRYDADYVLIYPAPNLYHLVPATVAAQGFDMERLKAALAQHVGSAK